MADQDPTAVLDYTSDGKVREATFNWPPDSEPVVDDDGKPVYEVEEDANGEAILDEFSRPKLKMGPDGTPVAKMTPQPTHGAQKPITVRYVPLTRSMRMEAIDAATKLHINRHRKPGVKLNDLERELVNRKVKWTNLKGIPGTGWDTLADPALGDRIVKEIKLWEEFGGKKAIEEGKPMPPGPRAPGG